MLSLFVGGGMASFADPPGGVPISASGSQPPDGRLPLPAPAGPELVAAGGREGFLLVNRRPPPSTAPQFERRSPLAGVGVATCCAFPHWQAPGQPGEGFPHLEREDGRMFCALPSSYSEDGNDLLRF